MPKYLIIATGGSTTTLWGEDTVNIQVVDDCEGDDPQSAFDAWVADPDVQVFKGEYEDYTLVQIADGTPTWGFDVWEPDNWTKKNDMYDEEDED